METNVLELQQVEKTIDGATDELARKLFELSLAYSGGGLAEVSFD
jgi:hypothetical protein